MSVWLRLECGPAGISVENVACEMTSVARRLDLPVVCSFNGFDIHAEPATSLRSVLAEYCDAVRFHAEVEAVHEPIAR
jgi:hypothetical protein